MVNSYLGLFSVTNSRWHPFSRSYGVILQSSLTMLLSSVLGFSPRPPVSVCGTGFIQLFSNFSRQREFINFVTIFHSTSRLPIAWRIFLPYWYPACTGTIHPRLPLSLRVPTVLLYCSTGISTCCPSATALALTLGPDSPRADQLYPGNLGYSA